MAIRSGPAGLFHGVFLPSVTVVSEVRDCALVCCWAAGETGVRSDDGTSLPSAQEGESKGWHGSGTCLKPADAT